VVFLMEELRSFTGVGAGGRHHLGVPAEIGSVAPHLPSSTRLSLAPWLRDEPHQRLGCLVALSDARDVRASSIEEPYMPTNGSLSWLGTGVAFLGYALAPAQCCQLQLFGLFG
jgi:hypothetical protein